MASNRQVVYVVVNRRLRTFVLGLVPIAALGTLASLDHVPGTDIDLTVPYAAEGPGPTFNTLDDYDGKPVIDIQGAELDSTSGNLNMTTVAVRTHMSLAQALYRLVATQDTIVPIEQIFPPGFSEEQVQENNKIAFSTSENAATAAALRYLNRPFDVRVEEILPESSAKDVLAPGDIIVAVDGRTVADPMTVRTAVRAHAPGEDVSIKIRKDSGEEAVHKLKLGQSKQEAGKAQLGILMSAQSAEGIQVDYNLDDIGGPSAGLIFSLAVVDKLSPGEINGGKFVAGTGTIKEDGTVGPIGGIVHKIQAASDAGAEVFLSPRQNCGEALTRKHDNLTIVAVDSLEDAISQLDAYNRGDKEHLRTCEQAKN